MRPNHWKIRPLCPNFARALTTTRMGYAKRLSDVRRRRVQSNRSSGVPSNDRFNRPLSGGLVADRDTPDLRCVAGMGMHSVRARPCADFIVAKSISLRTTLVAGRSEKQHRGPIVSAHVTCRIRNDKSGQRGRLVAHGTGCQMCRCRHG